MEAIEVQHLEVSELESAEREPRPTHREPEVPDLRVAEPLSRWKSQRCPWLLRWSSGAIQAVAAVLGLAGGAAVSYAIFAQAPPASVLGRLFDLQNIQGWLPSVMVGMFCWGMAVCLMRFLRVRCIEKVTRMEMAAELVRDLKSSSLVQVLAHLEKLRIADVSPLFRRIRIVLRQWRARPSLQDSLSLLNQQAVSEGEEVQHAYGVVKTFVWALPVLGLIGTVIGIAQAVGDFGSLMDGNLEDVAIIKSNLVQVTAGLSFAFTTTLLGLLGALLLVLPSSALQAREEKSVTRTDSMVSDMFLPELQRLYPEPTVKSGGGLERSEEILVHVVETATQTAGEAIDKMVRQAEERLVESAAQIGAELAKSSDEFLARLSLIRESMDSQAADFRAGIAHSAASSIETARKLEGAMEKHDKAAAEASSSMQQLLASSRNLLEGQGVLVQSMNAMTEGDTLKSIESLARIMSAVAGQNEVAGHALKNMAEATERVTQCQQTLQENLQRMETMGLTAALENLGNTLEQVSGVLMRFQEPIVFQAVRVSSVMGKEAAA